MEASDKVRNSLVTADDQYTQQTPKLPPMGEGEQKEKRLTQISQLSEVLPKEGSDDGHGGKQSPGFIDEKYQDPPQ